MILSFLIVYITGFFFSVIANVLFIKVAEKFKLMDVPGEIARKDHLKPTPLSGGLSIFSSIFLTVFILLFVFLKFSPLSSKFLPFIKPHLSGAESKISYLIIIALGGLIILFLGLFDDKKGVSPAFKILTTFFVVLFLFIMKVRVSFFISSPVIIFIVTFLWIIFMTNSFNLLDNMNGSACITAVSSSVLLLLIAVISNQIFISFYLLVLLAALSGFLFFNWPESRAFLGDSGALFIGYTLAVIALLQTYYIEGYTSQASVLAPLFAFTVPCYDTLSVIIIRIKNGVPVYKGDKNHVTHRINKYGLGKKYVVLLTGLINTISFLFFIPIYLSKDFSLSKGIIVFLSILSFLFLIEFFIHRKLNNDNGL